VKTPIHLPGFIKSTARRWHIMETWKTQWFCWYSQRVYGKRVVACFLLPCSSFAAKSSHALRWTVCVVPILGHEMILLCLTVYDAFVSCVRYWNRFVYL